MRFIDTNRFSPVTHGKDLPDEEDYFFLAPDRITDAFLKKGNYYIDESWWLRQEDRCKNGYEVNNAIAKGGDMFIDDLDALWYGKDCYIPRYDLLYKNGTVRISGRMYFYLNFWPIYRAIKGRLGKTYANPKFLGLDFFFFHRIEMMIAQGKDGQELKGRQEGYSMKGAGGVLSYNYTFISDSQNIIVAGISDDSDYTMLQCNTGLDLLKNTQFYKKRDVDNISHITSLNTGASIEAITAKDNPQALSRFSPFWIWYEEIGKGKRGWSLGVARYVKPSIMTEGEKSGWQHFIGTAGEEGEGVFDLEKRHYKPDEYNMLSFLNHFEKDRDGLDQKVGHFTGKQWYHLIDEDGNPKIGESIENIEDDRKSMDSEEKYKDVTQRALYASDAFSAPTAGFFGEHIIMALSRRKTFLQSRKGFNIQRKGRLEWINPDKPQKGVRWHEDQNGWLTIIEPPEVDNDGKPFLNLYYGGLDSYDQDVAMTSNSKGSLSIRKAFRAGSDSPHFNTFVAQLIERPTVEQGGAEKFYEHSAKVLTWYGCQVNIEYSNLRIFQWFTDHGFEHLLMLRPMLAFAGRILNTQVSNRYGTDKSLKPQILAILKDRLTEEYIDRMYLVDQIIALSKYKYDSTGKKFNCDITISIAEAEVAAKEMEFSVVKSAEDVLKSKGYMSYKRDKSGLLKTVMN